MKVRYFYNKETSCWTVQAVEDHKVIKSIETPNRQLVHIYLLLLGRRYKAENLKQFES